MNLHATIDATAIMGERMSKGSNHGNSFDSIQSRLLMNARISSLKVSPLSAPSSVQFHPLVVSIIKWVFSLSEKKLCVEKENANGSEAPLTCHSPSAVTLNSRLALKILLRSAQFFTVERSRKSFFFSLIENATRVDGMAWFGRESS